MPDSTPNIGLGSLVELAPASSSSWATVGFVTNVNGPQEAVQLLEVTNMQSTSKEYIPGVPDGGEVSFETNYASDHATHNSSTGVLYFLRGRLPCQIRLTQPGGSTTSRETYQGYITKADRTNPVDGVRKLSVTFKITGAISVG